MIALTEIQNILPQYNDKNKIKINLKTLEDKISIFCGRDEVLNDKKDVIEFIRNAQQKEIRDMLKSIFDDNNISYNEVALNKRLKRGDKTSEFFDRVFTVNGSKNGNKTNDNVKEKEAVNMNTEKIKSHRHDMRAESLNLENAQRIIRNWREVRINGIDVKPIAIKRGLPVDAADNMNIRIADASNLNGNVILYSARDKIVVAAGSFVDNGKDKCFVFPSENIKYEALERQESFALALLSDGNSNEYFVAERDVIVHLTELEETEKVLCIDFGTSNTTAGSYGLKDPFGSAPEYVEFVDTTSDSVSPKYSYTMPTMVYIASCENNEIKYKFGFEAQKELIDNDFSPKGSFFSEIKRWITSMDEKVKIHGANAERCVMEVTHRDIISAYIKYIIDLSQRFFKVKFRYLHFSAPVKLKELFIQEMSEILKNNYKVLGESESLDEGVAVIYDTLSTDIEFSENGRKKSVLVFDCGGGTTDLAKCAYEVNQDAFGKTLRLNIGYVNGDSNFGGNNVTYRIMQILKIKLAAKISGDDTICNDILKLIPKTEDDIMLEIDESISNKDILYRDFEEMYNKVNEYIPTDYDEERDYAEDFICKKRNFYYLWDIAENMKLEFHNSTNRVHMNFSDDTDKNICLRSDKQYYIYCRKGTNQLLERYDNPADNLDITIKEITQALMPDLYALMNGVLPQDEAGYLNRYDVYKFSGQSCHINLFKVLFKEFMPGKSLRSAATRKVIDDNIMRYKMPCLTGCIKFVQAKRTGNIDIKMEYDDPNLMYTIEDIDRNNILLDGNGNINVKFERYEAREVRLKISDRNGVKNQLTYYFKTVNTNKEIKLFTLINRVNESTYLSRQILEAKIEDELSGFDFSNSESERAKIIFVVPSNNSYCFKIYFVVKDKNNNYFLQDECSLAFENEKLNCFFDGKH